MVAVSDIQAVLAFIDARLDEGKRRADGLMFACRNPDKAPDFFACGGPAAEAYWEYFTPRLMLRNIETLREVLAAHRPLEPGKYGNDVPRCSACVTERYGYQEDWQANPWPCRTVRLVMSAWDDHPDYTALSLPPLEQAA